MFRTVYNRALEMFSPVVIEIPESKVCPYLEYHDHKRFPYLEEKSRIREGSFGAMKKLEIMSDYLHPTMRERMSPYSTNKKLFFALKSVKIIPDAPLMNMERDVLSMVSRINGPASENIITLMACYEWRGSVHFLFPFVEADLSDLLRNNNSRCPSGLRERLKGNESLLDHWLWQQMEGVSRALSAFHNQMENPFKDVKGKVIALHFDLKPANILVTSGPGPDGLTLKITDFGQSIIQIIDDDKDISLPHNTGDPRYGPPESRPPLRQLNQPYGDGLSVLLNYDVWSLGCIMIEVLIHLLGGSLKDFDEELQGSFFKISDDSNDPGGLKECVEDRLKLFEQAFEDGSAQTKYMKDIVSLLRDMLQHDKNNRVYSSTVIQRLEEAKDKFEALDGGRDQLIVEVEKHGIKGRKGFRQLGWDNGTTIVSFSEIFEFSSQQRKPINIYTWSDTRTVTVVTDSPTTEVLLFQGALFQRRILSPIRISISALAPKYKEKAPKVDYQDSYIQLWAPDGPNYVQPQATEARSDRSQPRGSIDSSSTGPCENKSTASEKPCETMVILFRHHRPLVFALKKCPIKITRCNQTSIKIDNRIRSQDSIHVLHPKLYQTWKSQNSSDVLKRPCLPIEPDTERLLDLNNVDLLKILDIIITLRNNQDLKSFYKATETVWEE
ncbi:serine threonine kinase [Fusarium acutatum]|uniref:non-specific serine/threonine protein kinase n=1 Tax=Fusarium acutatum TaxID=78861 RepID=A0A8H4K2R3_9HYPO|nr:serine threonine kinase [Fusarium acutatum]